MKESFGWSTSVGRWIGVPVRLHLLLFLFCATILGIEFSAVGTSHQIGLGTGFATITVLLGSLIVHEVAHLFAIANLGGHVDQVLLMPWGGNSDFELTGTHRSKICVYSAGPFANGVIFALGAVLLIQSGNADLAQLTNPFRPHEFDFAQSQTSLFKIATWINFQLMIVNLIPCFPFDGAAIVRGLIETMNTGLPKVRIESAIMVMGHAVAFTMIGISLLIRDYTLGPIESTWMLLMLGGITLIYAARHSYLEETRVDDPYWGGNVNTDLGSFFEDDPADEFLSESERSNYSQWLTEKQEERLNYEMQVEEEEDRLADDILMKLHGDGLASLSEHDRLILDRVSARLRRRRGQSV